MAYQVKTTTSYGGRLTNALKGIVAGFIMFVIGTVLLFWNEGHFVKIRKALNEAQDLTVSIDDVSTLNPELEGQLIHASARAETDALLEDHVFGVKEQAIALKRRVQYYQWVERSKTETRDKLGGGQEKTTTYTYQKRWVSSPTKSDNFHDPAYQDKNWIWTNVDDKTAYADQVSFGAYRLPTFFIRAIGNAEPVNVHLTPDQIDEWTKLVASHPRAPTPPEVNEEEGEEKEETSVAEVRWVHVKDNTVYLGQEPRAPEIGDVRITFEKVPSQQISLIGKVKGSTFEEYKARNGQTISRLASGTVSAMAMFDSAHQENRMLTWILRLVGVLLVCGGLRGIFGILEAIAKVIPPLGTLIGAGVGLVCVVVGVAWSLIWIGIAWLTYRPLVGVPLLVVAIGGLAWLRTKGKEKATA